MFFLHSPEVSDPEAAWGVVMKDILPPVLLGLLIASFFAAAMSSADTYATTSSAMIVDFIYRKILRPAGSTLHYLFCARLWAVGSIVIAALTTIWIGSIEQYVKLTLSLLSFLGIPIYFGVIWRRANRTGMWWSLGLGSVSYLLITQIMPLAELIDRENAFSTAVFTSTALALIGMTLGSLFGQAEDELKVMRFHVILNTPIGQEQRLVDAGIRLPAMIDAGLVTNEPETTNERTLRKLYDEDAADKFYGHASQIELRRERNLSWYYPGFFGVIGACIALIVVTWLGTRLLFVW